VAEEIADPFDKKHLFMTNPISQNYDLSALIHKNDLLEIDLPKSSAMHNSRCKVGNAVLSEQDLIRDSSDVAVKFQDRHRVMSEKFESN